MKVSDEYIKVATLNNSPFGQLTISRLRAEDIDVRIRNANTSAVYQLDTLGMSVEVPVAQAAKARQIIEEINESGGQPNYEVDHTEADEEDIEFEKRVYERNKTIEESRPPYLIFFLLFIMMIIAVIINTLLK